jgi:cob(I)alamin adenosyltransferase
MPIYTKTGDTGMTSLFGGKRVLKSEALVDAYGSVDELNSWMGLIAAEQMQEHIKDLLYKIQSDLFTIGGNLAGWKSDLAVLATRVTEMEVEIDVMEKEVVPLTNFILPGGSPLSARIHIARSICRKVERQVVALAQKEQVDASIIQYLNRLSDLCFMLARFINKQANVEDVIWSGIPRQEKSK